MFVYNNNNNNIINLLLVVSLAVTLVVADTGVDTGAKCEPYFGNSQCDGLLLSPESVYVPGGYTQKTLLDAMNFKVAALTSQNTCNVSSSFISSYVCNAAFRPCTNVTTNPSVAGFASLGLFHGACYTDCMRLSDECQLSSFLLNCNATRPNSQIYENPDGPNVYNLTSLGGSDPYPVSCFLNNFTTNGTVGFTCPSQLVPRNSTGEDKERDKKNGYFFAGNLPCVFKCPAPIYTPRQWKSFYNTIYVTTTISFICTSWTIITYLFVNRKHDRHSICLVFMSFGLWLISITDFILIGREGYTVMCPEPGRFATQSDPYCAATASIFQYGAVTAISWWTIMTFDLWILLRKVKSQKSYQLYYVIALTLLAIFFTVLPAGLKEYSAGFGRIGCWIGDLKALDGLFWAPFTLCLIIGSVFMIMVLVEIYKVIINVDNGKKKSKRIVKYNLKPFLILFILFVEFIFLFGYSLYTQTHQSEVEAALTVWVRCLIESPTPDTCTVNPLPYGAHFFYFFFVRLLGIELVVFYGINQRAKKIWFKSVFFHNKFYSVSALTTDRRSSNSSGNSSNSYDSRSVKMSGRAESYDTSGVEQNNESRQV
ncbi:hypothetical protein SAMD00019534_001590 [Acytostelium subglobosum LB1]|uniref:hypothetical protein n=1 Tax=Acytostelium subglobosum LB1 TaxID=1410327 RepID=UPI00064499C3|nr:hypothetical protein SAMD00019534_001590 [Acytostelium subglobosum LB1]GAM16984.1 hypothetical protein SAMD00019534_001590 [Acytostelium subglobosum LB1]|eukprot:XP_012759046.1 hypothetical protein SAMD00019534_001590 [Acytostelium subglobosum LB1]